MHQQRRAPWTLILLTALAAIPATAAPIVVNFDSFTGMGYQPPLAIPAASRLSNQLLATNGVLFSSGSPYVAILNLGIGHATSGTNGIGGSTVDGNLTYSTASPITISFWDPQHTANAATTDFVSIKGDLASTPGVSATLSAYNLQNQLINSVLHNDAPGQVWSISAAGIHSVVWSGVNVVDNVGGAIALDDLTFNPVSAPEPSTIGLVGLAFLVPRRRTLRQ